MADVFISYKSGSTLPLVRDMICPALENAGFTCWYAGRDSAPSAYPGQLKRAIESCRIFLLVLDQAALHAGHIKSETAIAFRQWSEGKPITLIPFRVDSCNLREDDDLDYFLILQQVVDGRPPDAAHIQDLVGRIAKILTKPS